MCPGMPPPDFVLGGLAVLSRGRPSMTYFKQSIALCCLAQSHLWHIPRFLAQEQRSRKVRQYSNDFLNTFCSSCFKNLFMTTLVAFKILFK
jgi:hypothetical protein